MKRFNFNYCSQNFEQNNAWRVLLKCNAGRLLFKNKTNRYTDSQKQEIVMSKNVTQNTFQKKIKK